MKTINKLCVILAIVLLVAGCRKEEFLQEPTLEATDQSIPIPTIEDIKSQAANKNTTVICAPQTVPPGFELVSYFNDPFCNTGFNYIAGYNAAVIGLIGSPFIYNAGSGCDDNYCI